MARPVRQRGFTLFELAVVASVFAILVAVFLNRASHYQQQAQQVAVAQMLGVLRTSLRVQVLHLYLADHRDRLPALARQNPFDWLDDKPANYLGEFAQPDLEKLPTGNWLYDRKEQKIIYLFSNGNIFPSTGVDAVKFKVTLPSADADLDKLAQEPDIVVWKSPDSAAN
ncbi:type II secretion system protein [Janthinobacterium violaceinigrum]|uniref:Prepilin-type N-terminal cleavage/methylation domain-containing protein n=1 Tax=Janthinobacterium violaceinigrum TaxID=2654252 RepID=A0A6I1HU05_9BURK|nr:prepilin-type N-terminal cleavage/methylation domain-containing protein [Janthinobacterium violaceinigrum]KAB8061330.1 prepilin-type N-terminal cleavage/methylation domain-containing protein [Janthinobacterium violaceinigrum]